MDDTENVSDKLSKISTNPNSDDVIETLHIATREATRTDANVKHTSQQTLVISIIDSLWKIIVNQDKQLCPSNRLLKECVKILNDVASFNEANARLIIKVRMSSTHTNYFNTTYLNLYFLV